MRALDIIKELRHIVDTEGNLEVSISVAKQPKVTEQNYLVADARFVVVEGYEEEEPVISIRDWPY